MNLVMVLTYKNWAEFHRIALPANGNFVITAKQGDSPLMISGWVEKEEPINVVESLQSLRRASSPQPTETAVKDGPAGTGRHA